MKCFNIFRVVTFFIVILSTIASAEISSSPSNKPIEENQQDASAIKLENLSYDGTGNSLKSIQVAALPAAIAGNIVAIQICRQTMLALGESAGLETLTFDKVKSISEPALNSWSSLVENKVKSGDPFYKCVLGIMYFTGKGKEKDERKAAALWTEAADAGYHDALFKLGKLHHSGQLFPKDVETALKFYQQAAEAGSATAFYDLGAIYFTGDGVPENRQLAAKYFQKSAELGYAPGQCDTGLCYLNGHGVAKDRNAAINWLNKAAEQGDIKAQYNLSYLGGVELPMVKPPLDVPNWYSGTKKHHYGQEAPKKFLGVEICCLKGDYRHIRNCDIETLDWSLEADLANLNGEGDGWTPLTLAIATGCPNMIQYLIDKGADPSERHREYNFTPLHLAVLTGQENIAEHLINQGAELNAVYTPPSSMYWYNEMRGTPANIAVRLRKYSILELLLQKGADCNIKNTDGYTVFEVAVNAGAKDIVENIYNKLGIPVPDVVPTVEEVISTIQACSHPAEKSAAEEKLQKLLQENPELARKRNRLGETPLHFAIHSHLKEIASRLIVDYGADVNAKDNNGRTPLLYGANTEELINFLVSNGADINAADNDGRTALHQYSRLPDAKYSLKIVECLLRVGAEKDIRDKSDRLPYDYAVERGFTETANILKVQ